MRVFLPQLDLEEKNALMRSIEALPHAPRGPAGNELDSRGAVDILGHRGLPASARRTLSRIGGAPPGFAAPPPFRSSGSHRWPSASHVAVGALELGQQRAG